MFGSNMFGQGMFGQGYASIVQQVLEVIHGYTQAVAGFFRFTRRLN